MYKELLGQIADRFSAGEFQQEFVEAREDYFSEAGKIFEDDPLYERKISGFIEWYLLDRVLDKQRETPAEHFLKISEAGSYDRELLNALILSQRSLFNLKNIKKYILEDLLYDVGKNYTLPKLCIEQNLFFGLEKNQILDARVYCYEDEVYLTETFWAHSKEASVCIKKELKKNNHLIRKNISTVLDFAFMAYRSRQFSHVDLKEIYSMEKIKILRSEIKSAKK